MNSDVRVTTDEQSIRRIRERLDYILDLMDKEHHVASTHSERNAFQAVIRILLQQMRLEIGVVYTKTNDREDGIPF